MTRSSKSRSQFLLLFVRSELLNLAYHTQGEGGIGFHLLKEGQSTNLQKLFYSTTLSLRDDSLVDIFEIEENFEKAAHRTRKTKSKWPPQSYLQRYSSHVHDSPAFLKNSLYPVKCTHMRSRV